MAVAITPGFDANKPAAEGYFQPDVWMTADRELPVAGARLFRFGTSKPAEGMLLLERHGGILISGDCLQNWATTDEYFSLVGKVMMRSMGFIKAHNVGPGWLSGAKPEVAEVKSLLDLTFEHVLPAHGAEVIGGARDKYRPVIQGLS